MLLIFARLLLPYRKNGCAVYLPFSIFFFFFFFTRMPFGLSFSTKVAKTNPNDEKSENKERKEKSKHVKS